MKKILMTLIFALVANLVQAQYRKILSVLQFDNLEHKVKSDYGSKTNPVESGAFINLNNPQSRNAGFVRLFNSYRWPNGEKINFSKRHSTQGLGSKGIVDVYTLVNPETGDTILLYVDPYKTSEKYNVPKGLFALDATILKSEIEPILQQIEEVNNAEDGTKLKLHIGEIMNYISSNFDQNQLIDLTQLEFLRDDKKADKELTTHLMMIYVMSKFYAMAKDIDNERDYAFDKMKANYKKYIKANPQAERGKLGEKLN